MKTRLSSRLILGVVIIEAVMLSLLVWNSVRLISSSHAHLLEQSTREQATLLANSLAPGLVFDDRATLQDVLSLLKTKANLKYAAVYNPGGQLLSSLGTPPVFTTGWTSDEHYEDAKKDGVFDIEKPILVSGQLLGTLRVGYSIRDVEELTEKTRWQNTSIAAIELVLTITATILLGIVLTRHLRHLESGVRTLKQGNLQARIDIHSNDEIGDLAREFNLLAEHLQITQDALQQEHENLSQEKKRLDTLLHGINAVVWEADTRSETFTFVSKEATRLLGYPLADWNGFTFFEKHLHPDDVEWVMTELRQACRQPSSHSLDYRMLNSMGRYVWIRDISTCEKDEHGNMKIRGLLMDVTEEKAAEERILFLADHDALTGLINRRRFQEELKLQIQYAQRYQHEGALLFIDLDQFKYINDSFGHQMGDEFLIQVSNRLNSVIRKTDLLGRLGGDEFGIILPETGEKEAKKVASVLLRTLNEKKIELFQGQNAHVQASIGIAIFPTQSQSPGELLAMADMAMYNAKEIGRNQFYLYSEDDRYVERIHAKIHWEERIRSALQNQHFKLLYQPVVELRSGKVTHYEALLRMIDEDGSLIPPGAFLEVAERYGLIREIDHWVLNSAIETQAKSLLRGVPLKIAVNLSGRHFGSTEILTMVKKAIEYHHADPESLIFEVTETAAVENLEEAHTFIEALRNLGCRFALDDFGIGFSSFYYLKNLPVDYVKIDGSFVRNLHNDESDSIFVQTINDLAHGLNITTIAEFIEHKDTVEKLRKLGVDQGQGYYLGKPEPLDLLDDQPDIRQSLPETSNLQ